MAPLIDGDLRGILNAQAGFERFRLDRHQPSADLAWAVDRYWFIRWDLRGEGPYEQRVIPHPAVHLVFETGRGHIQGISSLEFVRRIEGRGHVVGVKFRPAGFRPFLGRAVSTIAGQRLPASLLLGPGTDEVGEVARIDEVARTLDQIDDPVQSTEVVENLLRSFGDVGPLPMTATVNAIVARIERDRTITRVDDLAGHLRMTTRRLQRLFADHVGLGPKWVINRCRVHEVAERAAGPEPVDWAELAIELGYSDQSHLVREFTAAVGSSPGRYTRHAAIPTKPPLSRPLVTGK